MNSEPIRRDWPLMVLLCANDYRLQPVQLQKSLFLVDRLAAPKTGGGRLYDFKPYNYGPFDHQVYADLDSATGDSLVERVQSNAYPGHDFKLTPNGIRRAENALALLPKDKRQVLKNIVQWVNSLSFRELIGAIYKRFPEFRENSVFYS